MVPRSGRSARGAGGGSWTFWSSPCQPPNCGSRMPCSRIQADQHLLADSLQGDAAPCDG